MLLFGVLCFLVPPALPVSWFTLALPHRLVAVADALLGMFNIDLLLLTHEHSEGRQRQLAERVATDDLSAYGPLQIQSCATMPPSAVRMVWRKCCTLHFRERKDEMHDLCVFPLFSVLHTLCYNVCC
jgi:hypothetical protein